MVGAGKAVDRAQLGQDRSELAAVAVGEGVAGQHPLDTDAMGGEEVAGAAEEPGAGVAALVGQDLGVGQPRVVVDGGGEVVIADPVAAAVA
jgi:hypothetical protein